MTSIPAPDFTLEEPGTIRFTAVRAFHGQRLTAFCLTLREDANRAAYLADSSSYMARHGLTDEERALVGARDWTGLLLCGAHLQAVLKLAAAHGASLFDIGAHNIGVGVEELVAACPRFVSAIPEEG